MNILRSSPPNRRYCKFTNYEGIGAIELQFTTFDSDRLRVGLSQTK